jgi:uncharacterized protein involved in outer membrane biogenesis
MDPSAAAPHARPRSMRFARRAAVAVGVLLLLMLAAWLALPPILKSQGEQRLSALLGREVRIGRVVVKPWSLELSVEQLSIGAAAGAARREPQFSVERVHVNADLRSLLRLAPVIEAVNIEGPRLHVSRLAEGRYDIDDLLQRFRGGPPAPADAQPQPFALYNLRLADGSIEFDDQPVQRQHRVQDLQLTLPFLSNLADHVEVKVEPRLAFKLAGAAFDSGAQAQPFAQDRASQFDLRIADLDLAPWLPYLPADLPLRPSRGLIAGQFQIQFVLPPGGSPRVSVKGQAGLRDFALVGNDKAAEPVLRWTQLQVGLDDVQPLARRVALGTVALDGAQLDLRRAADGSLNLLPAAPATAKATPAVTAPAAASAAAASPSSPAWQVSIEKIALNDARIDWRDAGTQPAAALRAEALALTVQALRWPFEAAAPLKLTGRVGPVEGNGGAAAAFSVEGQASDRSAKTALDIQGVDLRWFAPYLAQSLKPRLEGRAALRATLDWARGAEPRLALSQIQATLNDLRLEQGSPVRQRGAAAPPAASVASFSLSEGSIDLLAQRVALGGIKIERPALNLHRDREGRWNFMEWAVPAPAARNSAPATAAPPWQVQLGQLQLSGGELRLHDERPSPAAGSDAPAVRLRAEGVGAQVRNLVWPGAAMAATQLQLRLAADTAADTGAAGKPSAAAAKANAAIGRIDWNGQLATAPLQARGALRIERAPVHLFEPYFGSGLNLELLRAEATWRGDVAFAQRASGLEASARGDALLGDLRVHERAAANVQGDELLSWQSLALRGLQFVLKPGAKPSLDIKEAALTDFYSRLVITEQGRFNLRDVAGAPEAAASAPAPAASAPAAGRALPIDLNIGGTQLVNGKIDFTDRFIRPNYSAALTELNGRLGPFNSASAAMATLDLRGRAAGTALLEISGALNPTANPPVLDIRAKASDLELAPFSPYAGRYAGYGIERGKLTMDVAYKIDPDGRLDAKNQVILNQLTFGDKVDSPDATKLPVRLAIALLTDRNGVIDINLPVSGSINDPQFSVFGIVLKIIGNLLVKALTSPFALLSGGGSEDLSFVAFAPGTTRITDAGRATLDKVAKALTERPALKMTVTGASDPVSEREASQRAALDARIQAEQRREALRGGAAADAPLPALTPALREPIVKRLYADAKLPNKPRNLIGLAKDIPAAEMEALLLAATLVSTDTARELALQRGLAVRDALIAKGLPSERLFLAAPKLRASGEDDAAWSPRVQLALSTN